MQIFTFYNFRRMPKKTSFKFQHEIRDQSFFHKMANKMKGGLNIKAENVKVEGVKFMLRSTIIWSKTVKI